MPTIEIHIKGESYLLQDIPLELIPNARLNEDRNIIYLEVSDEIKDEEAKSLAQEFIARLNGAIRIREQNIDSKTFSTTVVAVRREESNSFNINGVALIRNPLVEPEFQIGRILTTALNSIQLRELLICLSSSNGFWVKAMNAIDTIEYHFPTLIRGMKTDPVFADRHSRFIGTANNFANLSSNARHGQLGHKKVSKPISHAEAKEHLNTIIQAVITTK